MPTWTDAHPDAAADVLLPAYDGADQARACVHCATTSVSHLKKGKFEQYIKDDREYVQVMVKRASDGMVLTYGPEKKQIPGRGAYEVHGPAE